MSQSSTSRRGRGAPAAADEVDRVPAGTQARAQGPAQVEALAAAGPPRAALAPPRRRQLEVGHQPPQARELLGLSAAKLFSARRSSSLASASGTSISRPSASPSPGAALGRSPAPSSATPSRGTALAPAAAAAGSRAPSSGGE